MENKFNFEGVVHKLDPATSGTSKAGKEWTKRDIVLSFKETWQDGSVVEKYAKFSFMNKAVENTMAVEVGATVSLVFSVGSREWEGKYYTDMNGFGLKVILQPGQVLDTAQAAVGADISEEDDLPF